MTFGQERLLQAEAEADNERFLAEQEQTFALELTSRPEGHDQAAVASHAAGRKKTTTEKGKKSERRAGKEDTASLLTNADLEI